MFHFLDVHFRLRKLLLAAGKLRSNCETFDSPVSGNDLLLFLLLRVPASDSVDVVDFVEADLFDVVFVSVVLRDDDDTRERVGGDLFAIFLLAFRLACGDCVSECSCSSERGGDVDPFRRCIAGRSLFSPFTLLFSMVFVGPFCTCFRLVVGVIGVEYDEFCRLDRRPFSGCGDGKPFCRRGLDKLLVIDDLRDDDLEDALLSPFDSTTKGATFFKCSIRCVGLLIRSTDRRVRVMTFVFLNSATRAFRVRCELGGLPFTSIGSLVTTTFARDNRWLTLGVTFTFFSFSRLGLVCSVVDFCKRQ